jgi:hypothetical protein
MTRIAKRPERVTGGYTSFPWAVSDSVAYRGCSLAAKALLLEIARQHNGLNNGHLHASYKWLKSRGWNSNSVVQRARKILEDRGLIVCTRKGGFGIGSSRYAVTWHKINNYHGLDISLGGYCSGAWSLMDRPQPLIQQASRRTITVPLEKLVYPPLVSPQSTVRA